MLSCNLSLIHSWRLFVVHHQIWYASNLTVYSGVHSPLVRLYWWTDSELMVASRLLLHFLLRYFGDNRSTMLTDPTNCDSLTKILQWIWDSDCWCYSSCQKRFSFFLPPNPNSYPIFLQSYSLCICCNLNGWLPNKLYRKYIIIICFKIITISYV